MTITRLQRPSATKPELMEALTLGRMELPEGTTSFDPLAKKARKYLSIRPNEIKRLMSELLTDEERKTLGLPARRRYSSRAS